MGIQCPGYPPAEYSRTLHRAASVLFLTSLLQIEEQYLAASKSKSVKRPLGFELPEAAPVTNNKLLEKLKKTKRRWEEGFLVRVRHSQT